MYCEEKIQLKDDFWGEKVRLIREKVLPYQWEALNDRIEGADKSYCIRNFRTAARVNALRRQGVTLPEQPTDDFMSLPRGDALLPEHKKGDNAFYGYVFQDSDLYKWIEAAAYSLMMKADDSLEHTIDEMVDLLEEATLNDGYLDTFYSIKNPKKRFSNLRDHHELYCFGHLAEAAVAYYEATGKKQLLHLAERFADLICELFGKEEGKCHGYPGHELAEMALVRLYRHTGKTSYLELARYFVLERGREPNYFRKEHGEKDSDMRYYQAQQPVQEQMEAVGHAVRAMYLYSGLTDLAVEYDDGELAKVAKRLWKNVTRKKMYITGGVGATSHGEAFSYAYDLPADSAYAETCAAIGLVFWAKRMLQLQPKGEYADVMERALYNSVLSGISLDGTEFFYTNPLEVDPKACKEDERLWHVRSRRAKWFGCACCPPNLARLIGSITRYIAHHAENTTWIDLYMGSVLRTKWQGKTVEIETTSHLPYTSDIAVRLNNPSEAEGTLAIRIPGWAEQWSVEVEDEDGTVWPVDLANVQSETLNSCGDGQQKAGMSYEYREGYLYLAIYGQKKVIIRPHFAMKPVFYEANSLVRENSRQMSLVCGPLVYCLEEVDNGAQQHMLYASPEAVEQAETYTLPFLGREAVGYQFAGFRKKANTVSDPLYHKAEREEYQPVTLKWIPYFAWANREEGEMRVWIYKK